MGTTARPGARPSLPRRAPGDVVHVGRQPIFDRRPEGHAAFTTGLLSLIDGLLDAPMAELPLTESVAGALLDRSGPLGRLLDVATAYERLDVAAIDRHGVDPDDAAAAYVEAVTWADTVRRDLMAS